MHGSFWVGKTFVICVMLSISLTQCAQEVTESKNMNLNSVRTLGDGLSSELKAEYTKRVAEHTLKSPIQGRNDVTDIVKKYIHPGMSFAEAEEILRAASFTVSAHPTGAHPGDVDYRDDVYGSQTIEEKFPTAVKVDVQLSPKSQGDYSKVENVKAAIRLASI